MKLNSLNRTAWWFIFTLIFIGQVWCRVGPCSQQIMEELTSIMDEKFLDILGRLSRIEVALEEDKAKQDIVNQNIMIEFSNIGNRLSQIEGNFGLDKVKHSNQNQEIIGKLLEIEENIKVNVSQDFQEMSIQVSQLENNVMTSLLRKECPESEGFFMSSAYDQCFKAYQDPMRTWTSADSFCKSEGLELAHPLDHNVVALHTYLNENGGYLYWLGARANGSVFKWQHNGEELSSSNPLWTPGEPDEGFTPSTCLIMTASSYALRNHPGKSYRGNTCRGVAYYLCERIME